jgi:hypothetical protein
MKTTFTILITALSILAVILCPAQAKEYIMFGLLVMIISITRWESGQILKTLKANKKNERKVLNISDAIQQTEQPFCPYCGRKKEFKIYTDVNSGMVCKNRLCQIKKHDSL